MRDFTGILVETLARNQRNVYNDAKSSNQRIRILEEDQTFALTIGSYPPPPPPSHSNIEKVSTCHKEK